MQERDCKKYWFRCAFCSKFEKVTVFLTYFLYFSLSIHFFLLILQRPAKLCHLILCKIRWSGNGWAHTYKGVTALWFWQLRISQVQQNSQEQSNGASHWVYCIQPVLYPFVTIVGGSWIWEGIYIYAQRGAGRCSFRLFGQCESLQLWNEWQDLLHVLYARHEHCLTGASPE